MKLFLVLPLLLISLSVFGQVEEETSDETFIFFGQCMFDIADQDDMLALEAELRQHAKTDVVRLDWHTQRAWITTLWISNLDEDEFRSWFGEYAGSVSCINIGELGKDTPEQYPFTNCQN